MDGDLLRRADAQLKSYHYSLCGEWVSPCVGFYVRYVIPDKEPNSRVLVSIRVDKGSMVLWQEKSYKTVRAAERSTS